MRTPLPTLSACLTLVATATSVCLGGQVQLAWDTVHDPRVARYQVGVGVVSRSYGRRLMTTQTTAVITNLGAGQRYFFAVRACAADGSTCSPFSNEISATVADGTTGDANKADPNQPNVAVVPAKGVAQAGGDWTFVDAPSGLVDAVVITGPPTFHGADPGVVRLMNISDIGFELRFQEWDYRHRVFGDNAHAVEDIPYLVLEPGRHTMSDGSLWEVGTFDLGGTAAPLAVHFGKTFAKAPKLFLTVQTANGGQAVSVRARNVTGDGFETALFEEEALMDGHAVETIGYLAIDSPKGGGVIELNGVQVPYLLQSLNADERWSPVLSQRIKVEEERSNDNEIDHADETLHVLALGDQVFAQQVSHNGPDTTALRRLEPTNDAPMEWGLVRGIDHNWQVLPFAKTYRNPILVAKAVSNRGGDPGVVRIKDLCAIGARLRYEEWGYLDGKHWLPEDVFYVVSEAGERRLGGLNVEADRLITSKLGRAGQWEDVPFNTLFMAKPVVLSSVMSANGADPVITRVADLDAGGFALAMDEQESKADGHTSEVLGWIAITPGTATTSEGRKFWALSRELSDQLLAVRYPLPTSGRFPTVVSDVDSANGLDPVFLRYANPTNTQVELKLGEEQSKDSETGHVPEEVGVFVGE